VRRPSRSGPHPVVDGNRPRTWLSSNARVDEDELARILARAAQAGIEPERVVLALGVRGNMQRPSG
jgi:hypothetical protein